MSSVTMLFRRYVSKANVTLHYNFCSSWFSHLIFYIAYLQFFEYGSPEQRKELADKLSGQILNFSLQMYGCRVIQKVFLISTS